MAELHADVVVVGFGGAGACAAIEAADRGADVLVLERFGGGGATAVSGGVVYAGGGTRQQTAAGVVDTVDAMLAYLRTEVGDAVGEPTLRRFCTESAAQLAWLEDNGVPFDPSLCPYKTSYPNDRYYLYYSGSEQSEAPAIPAAPRGHRAHGRGTSGTVLFAALAAAARDRGVRVHRQTEVLDLTPAAGTAHTVTARTLAGAPRWVRRTHATLTRYARKPGLYYPPLRRALDAAAARLVTRYAEPLTVHARRGVVLAAGGFIANREMLRANAPAFRGGLALGTAGDDGAGIRLGTARGGATANLDRVSVWRFIAPPSAFLGGVVVNAAGQRFVDEARYGAVLGEAMVTAQGGRAWLLVDAAVLRTARRQLRRESQWFWWVQMLAVLRARTTGATLAEVAAAAGIDPAGLAATVAAYHGAAADPFGKPAAYRVPLDTPPYALIDLAVGANRAYPCPMMTLGGLRVHEDTGAVLDGAGAPVAGLYAAGRTASGICSRSYVSGLSLADCVFSGRRAGAAAANSATRVDRNKNVF